MTAPGWYYAEGDPGDSTRYWDGEMWVGAPVIGTPETAGGYDLIPPTPQAVVDYGAFDVLEAGAARATETFVETPTPIYGDPAAAVPTWQGYPGGLTVLVVVVSALKALPLVLFTILAALAKDWLETNGESFLGTADADAVESGIKFFLVILAIGGILLIAQFIGGTMQIPMLIFVPAVFMSLIDIGFSLLAIVGAVSLGEISLGLVMVLMITVAQVLIAVWSFSVRDVARR